MNKLKMFNTVRSRGSSLPRPLAGKETWFLDVWKRGDHSPGGYGEQHPRGQGRARLGWTQVLGKVGGGGLWAYNGLESRTWKC